MNSFSERLKESLRVNKMSQRELAKRINKTQATVNDYCTGKASPSVKVLALICKTLDESADYLLGLTD